MYVCLPLVDVGDDSMLGLAMRLLFFSPFSVNPMGPNRGYYVFLFLFCRSVSCLSFFFFSCLPPNYHTPLGATTHTATRRGSVGWSLLAPETRSACPEQVADSPWWRVLLSEAGFKKRLTNKCGWRRLGLIFSRAQNVGRFAKRFDDGRWVVDAKWKDRLLTNVSHLALFRAVCLVLSAEESGALKVGESASSCTKVAGRLPDPI